MSTETTPVFVLGSGRSGTRMIYRLLSGIPSIEIHHEFLCTHIQPVAALYFMNLLGKDEAKQELLKTHGAAIHYSKDQWWIDCSNKLSWVIEPLFELFPKAKFVNLVRDGRKVVSSFFHKLASEIYDDESVKILQEWIARRDELPMPPGEKKYWWNIPQKGQPFSEIFPYFDQFQRITYHWVEANRVIMESLRMVPEGQQLSLKLEELTRSRRVLSRLLAFVGLDYGEHFFEFLQTPQNVIFPMDFRLAPDQMEQFNRIAGAMMERLGYAGTEEYKVAY